MGYDDVSYLMQFCGEVALSLFGSPTNAFFKMYALVRGLPIFWILGVWQTPIIVLAN
jgi:hypothetical protein